MQVLTHNLWRGEHMPGVVDHVPGVNKPTGEERTIHARVYTQVVERRIHAQGGVPHLGS